MGNCLSSSPEWPARALLELSSSLGKPAQALLELSSSPEKPARAPLARGQLARGKTGEKHDFRSVRNNENMASSFQKY